MMFEIDFLIKKFPKKSTENISSLIDHEYIDGLFLFNKRFMQSSFYIFMNEKFGLPNMPYLNWLLLIIYFVIRDAQIHFSLFIHIMYAIL